MSKRYYSHDELFPAYASEHGGNMQIMRQIDKDTNIVLISAQGSAAEMWERIFEWVASQLENQRMVAESKMFGSKPDANTVRERQR